MTHSSNIDRARFAELLWFHLVVAVFAFSHIFVNIQVAMFIIYVFTATSVLMNG